MKGSTIAGVLVLAGLTGAGAFIGSGIDDLTEPELVPERLERPRPIRIPCEKATKELCPGGVNRLGDYCLCRTLEKEEVADEVTAAKIPVEDRVRVILCCHWLDPETKEERIRVGRIKGLEPVPPGCQVLKPKEDQDYIVIDASSNNEWLDIDDVASFNCCVDCKDDCWIRSGNHGHCFDCICDGNCKDYCPKPEPKEIKP